jgi:hypothetical protein
MSGLGVHSPATTGLIRVQVFVNQFHRNAPDYWPVVSEFISYRSVSNRRTPALSQLLSLFLDQSHNPLPNPFVAAFLEGLFQPLNFSPDLRYLPKRKHARECTINPN